MKVKKTDNSLPAIVSIPLSDTDKANRQGMNLRKKKIMMLAGASVLSYLAVIIFCIILWNNHKNNVASVDSIDPHAVYSKQQVAEVLAKRVEETKPKDDTDKENLQMYYEYKVGLLKYSNKDTELVTLYEDEILKKNIVLSFDGSANVLNAMRRTKRLFHAKELVEKIIEQLKIAKSANDSSMNSTLDIKITEYEQLRSTL